MSKQKGGKTIRRILLVAAAVAVLAGMLFGARALIAGNRSVAVIPVMNIADTWFDFGSSGYGQISQGGTQQVWNDTSMLIDEIFVSEGDRVRKGDPLLQYDVTQASLQEDSCRIEYEMAVRELERAEERLAYIRTFRPNERPEPLWRLYQEPVDIVLDEEGKLEIRSGKGSVEEYIKDGVYGITININCSTPITRNTFETLLSYDPEAELPHPEEDGQQEEESPAVPEDPDIPAQEEAEDKPDEEENEEQEEKPQVKPQMNFTFVIWEHFGEMDSVRIASVRSNPEEDGVARKRWLETVLPRKEGEEEPVFFFSLIYSVDSISGSIEETVKSPESEVFLFSKERANAQVPETERYTKEQIDEMLAEQNRLVREEKINVAQAELDWRKARQTASDGIVRADHDGVVISVGSPYSGSRDEPLIQLSSSEGYQLISTISELQLNSVKVGDEITVTMWSNGQTYSGRITKISPYPTDNSMSYSYSANMSYYTYTADLLCDDELQPWDGGEVQFTGGQEEGPSTFALEACYVREESGRSYVLKAGEDGRLVRQYVEVGRILYGGWSVEITGGLSLDDCIAFPYGKNAVEGAKADYEAEVMLW